MIPVSLELPKNDESTAAVAGQAPEATDTDELHNILLAASSSGISTFKHEPATGRYAAFAPELPITRGIPPEDTESEKTTILDALSAIGAFEAETTMLSSTLRAAGGPIGAPEIVESVATKIYVTRQILGVPVAGDYATATFTLQGDFVKLTAHWRPIESGASALATDLSQDEVQDLAALALVDYAAPLGDTAYQIEVGTVFRPRRLGDSSWAIELHGVAAIRDSDGNGGGQEGKIPSYEFVIEPISSLPSWVPTEGLAGGEEP